MLLNDCLLLIYGKLLLIVRFCSCIGIYANILEKNRVKFLGFASSAKLGNAAGGSISLLMSQMLFGGQ